MNICFICNEYPPGPHGGIGTATQVTARGLVRAGHNVRVVGVYSSGHPDPARADDQGVQVFRLHAPKYRLGWIVARYTLFRTVSTWSRAGEIDIVEAPDWEGWIAGWPPLRVPVIARLNGSATYFAGEMGQTPKSTLKRLESASLRRADFWCSVSQYTADKTRSLFYLPTGPDAILHNAVEIPPLQANTQVRSRDRVVFTGTLAIKKGVIQLVKAWPTVVEAFPGATLHIYGKDGEAPDGGSMQTFLRSQLTGQAAETVHFHGHTSREEVLKALQSTRLAVFPSYAEAFALAPLEAMACGCPVVYSLRGSGPELIEHGKNGLLVEPGNPGEIAEAITSLLKDDLLAARLGYAGRARVEERFSLEKVLPQNEAFYKQCIANFETQSHSTRRAPARLAPASGRDLTTDSDIVARFHSGTECGPQDHIPTEAHSPEHGVTVAVCTYKRAASLQRFLHSLASQDRQPARLVIVDASPDDQTEQMIRSYGPLDMLAGCVLYCRVAGRHKGLTRQRNFALRWVSTDLVAFFDDDVVLLEGCLREMETAYRRSEDPTAGVGALIENPDVSSRQHFLWKARLRLRIVPSLQPGRYYRSGISTPWDLALLQQDTVEGDWLPGTGAMWQTTLARSVGFNELFSGYSNGEDLEFSLRIGRLGKLLVARRARLLHLHESSGRPDAYQLGYMNLRNAYYIHRYCLPGRSWRDTAGFIYAFGLDTCLQCSNLLRPVRSAVTRPYLRGRLRFFRELLFRQI